MPGSALFNRSSRMWLQTAAAVPAENLTNGDYTCGCWYKLNASSNTNCGPFAIGGNNSGTGGGTGSGGLERPGRMHTDVSGTGSGDARKPFWNGEQGASSDILSSVQAALSTWHQLIITREASTKTLRLYLDGALVATLVTSANWNFGNANGFGGAGRPVVGTVLYTSATFQIDGLVTDHFFANVRWTDDEIALQWRCKLKADHPDLGAGLLVYWKLDNDTGTVTDGDSGLTSHGSVSSCDLKVATGVGIVAPTWSADHPFIEPSADAGGPYTTCGTNPVMLNGTAGPCDDDALWTTDGDGTFDDDTLVDATYTPGAGDVMAGSVNLTLTVSSAYYSDAVDIAELTIGEAPTVDAGGPYSTCGTTPVALNPTLSKYNDFEWTTDGDGTFDDANDPFTNYTPGAADVIAGTVTLTATIEDEPCGTDTDDATLTVSTPPVADAGGPYEGCGTTPVQLDATRVGASSLWTTSGTGTFNNAATVDAIYTPSAADVLAGSVTLTFTVQGASPCGTDEDEATLTITTPPTAEAGGPYHSSAGEPVDLTSSAVTNTASQAWTTDGDGSFDDNTLLHPRYTLGAADQVGGCTLTLTAQGEAPCGTAVDTALVIIDEPPEPPDPGPSVNTGVPQPRRFRLKPKIVNPWR